MNALALPFRSALLWLAVLATGAAPVRAAGAGFAVATFSADVTIPPGHAMIGGGNFYSSVVVDPLYAKGVVLLGGGSPIVFVSVDWCEIRNDAYTRWRELLAEAAGTTPDRVLVSAVHQHEAPVVDLTAQRLMEAHGLDNSICDLAFHEEAVQRVGRAVREALPKSRPITGLGIGQAKVERMASNRRYHLPDGSVSYTRSSAAAKNVLARDGEEVVLEARPVEIDALRNFPQAYNSGPPIFRGLYEDNDPKKRLLMIINYNTDVSQYWEWSGRGLRPFDDTNEAYKLGVNYLIYGLTH